MKLLRIYLLQGIAAGLCALLLALQTASEARSAVWFGFSYARLALMAVLLVLWLAWLVLTIAMWRSPARASQFLQAADGWLVGQQRLAPFMLHAGIVLVPALVVMIIILRTPLDFAAYGSLAPTTFPTIYSMVTRFLPLLCWLFWLAFSGLLVVGLRYWQALRKPATWHARHWLNSCILLLAGLASLAYGFVLIFQLRFFANNPAWYWQLAVLPFNLRAIWLAGLVMGLLALACWLFLARNRRLAALVLLGVAGVVFQMGIGYVDGGGLAAFRDRYLLRYHSSYLRHASENQLSIVENIRRYEELHSESQFTRTKPPGLLAFYIGLDQLVNGFPSTYSAPERLARTAWLVTYSFPLLSMLVLVLIYVFARRLLEQSLPDLGLIAAALFVVCPNIMLFSLYPDQAIYPGLFLVCAWLVIEVVRRQSLWLAFLLGLGLYLLTFFAFTFLPLFTFAGLFLLVDYWLHRRERRLLWQIWFGLAFLAGTLSAYLTLLGLFNYDFFTRFSMTVAINHAFDFYTRVGLQPPFGPESLSTRVPQALQAAWINNLDFASTVGFAIYILFAAQAIRLLVRFARGDRQPADGVLFSLLLNFIVLNAAGTAQGEVGRLWMFWVPVVVLLAAKELKPWVARDRRVLLGVLAVQVIMVFLTHYFQDLKM